MRFSVHFLSFFHIPSTGKCPNGPRLRHIILCDVGYINFSRIMLYIRKSITAHMPQIWVDEDAKRILDKEKAELKKTGRSGASLGDAIRSLRDGRYVIDH